MVTRTSRTDEATANARTAWARRWAVSLVVTLAGLVLAIWHIGNRSLPWEPVMLYLMVAILGYIAVKAASSIMLLERQVEELRNQVAGRSGPSSKPASHKAELTASEQAAADVPERFKTPRS